MISDHDIALTLKKSNDNENTSKSDEWPIQYFKPTPITPSPAQKLNNELNAQLDDYKYKYKYGNNDESPVNSSLVKDHNDTDPAIAYYQIKAQRRYHIDKQQANEFISNPTLRTVMLFFKFGMLFNGIEKLKSLNEDDRTKIMIVLISFLSLLKPEITMNLWKRVNDSVDIIRKAPEDSPLYVTPNFYLHMDKFDLESKLHTYIINCKKSWNSLATHYEERAESMLSEIKECKNPSVLSKMITHQLRLFDQPNPSHTTDKSKPKHEQPVEKPNEKDLYYRIMSEHQYPTFHKK